MRAHGGPELLFLPEALESQAEPEAAFTPITQMCKMHSGLLAQCGFYDPRLGRGLLLWGLEARVSGSLQ